MKDIDDSAYQVAVDFCKLEWLTERSFYSLIASLVKTFLEFRRETDLSEDSQDFVNQFSRKSILDWEESKFLSEEKLDFLEGLVNTHFSPETL